MSKPDGPIARRSEYVLEKVQHGSARALIGAYHYAGSAANTSVHAHGMFRRRNMIMVGAVLWMPPTANAAKALALRHLGSATRHREVLCLSRCACIPGAPKNLTGMMLAASERAVRRDTRWSLYVTYADEGEEHTGTIYRATGWAFDGRTKPETRWHDAHGRLVSKYATHSRTVAEMLALGCTRTKSTKLRFVKIANLKGPAT